MEGFRNRKQTKQKEIQTMKEFLKKLQCNYYNGS